MKRYIRSTHDEQGKPKPFDAAAQKAWDDAKGLGHFLDPRKAMTLDEIIAWCKEYDGQFPQDAPCFTSEQIKKGLALLVEHGLVTEVEE